MSGYVYFENEDLGTLKAGLINTEFGLDHYLGFIGTAPYFDGFIQDPDYGFAWKKTHQLCDCLSVETVAQFFLHDGEWNGSLRNHDQESVVGIHERNTFVARVAPKWTIDDETELTLGASALVGEIDSRLPGFVTDSRAVWGVDAVFVKGPMELRSEVLQWFGKSVPIRFTSGGASNRVTSFSTEAAYTIGPIKYRGQYSASFDANPDGRQNIWSLGGGSS